MYNVLNWYWIVGGSTSQVFSSASGTYVPITDTTYAAWLTGGRHPTSIDSEASLITVLAQQAPSVVVQSPAGLIAYANVKQWALATGGYSVTISGTPITFDTSTDGQALMTGKAVRLGQANPPATIQWQSAPNSWVTIAASDFLTAASETADFVQATFNTLASVEAAITAGTITTKAMVDAPPSPVLAWPANH